MTEVHGKSAASIRRPQKLAWFLVASPKWGWYYAVWAHGDPLTTGWRPGKSWAARAACRAERRLLKARR